MVRDGMSVFTKIVAIVSLASLTLSVLLFITGLIELPDKDMRVKEEYLVMDELDNMDYYGIMPGNEVVTRYVPYSYSIDAEKIRASLPRRDGNPQGPWWLTYEEMLADIYKIPDESLRNKMLNLAPHVGKKSNINLLSHKDKFVKDNGIGFVFYPQAIDIDRWGSLSYGYSSFGNSGCMYYAGAMIASSLTGKYINPAEFVIATRTLGVRGHTNAKPYVSTSAAINFILIWEELGLDVRAGDSNARIYDKSSFIDNVNDCLDSNGLVFIYVGAESVFTSSTHLLVIRDRVEDMYLMGDSSYYTTGNTVDTLFTKDEIKRGLNSYFLVYPGGI